MCGIIVFEMYFILKLFPPVCLDNINIYHTTYGSEIYKKIKINKKVFLLLSLVVFVCAFFNNIQLLNIQFI